MADIRNAILVPVPYPGLSGHLGEYLRSSFPQGSEILEAELAALIVQLSRIPLAVCRRRSPRSRCRLPNVASPPE